MMILIFCDVGDVFDDNGTISSKQEHLFEKSIFLVIRTNWFIKYFFTY